MSCHLIVCQITRKQQEYTTTALYENEKLVEVYLAPKQTESILGNIYIGRIKDFVKNLNAAFIEIAPGLKCFYPLETASAPIYTKKSNSPKLSQGDEILVQVVKESMKGKPPRVSTNLTFKGKHLAITTENHQLGISKKLPSHTRQHLKSLFEEIKPDNIGIILRTNSSNAKDPELLHEYQQLQTQSSKIIQTAKHRTCYSMMFKQPPEYLNQIQNINSSTLEKIITDDQTLYEQIAAFLKESQPADLQKLSYYNDKLLNLSKLYSLEVKLENALKERVWLKSGAYLIIQPTEALTVIDVNSGKSTNKKDAAKHHQQVNLEAAKEVAYQLRLRNITGIIIIDFISMDSPESEVQLMETLRSHTKTDPTPVQVVDITKLHLVELTRKKVKKSIYEQIKC